MKKLFQKKLLSSLSYFFVVIIFASMFVETNTIPILKLYGWHYSGQYTHKNLDTRYILPSGDTIIPPDQQEVEIRGVESAISLQPVLDNFLYKDFPDGWMRGLTEAERKPYLQLRKVPEFKREQCMVLPGILPQKKNQYFDLMRKVSGEVDGVIASQLQTKYHEFSDAQSVFAKREGKPKLRPLLAHAVHLATGGNGIQPTVCAISEVNTLHLYCDNWILDQKTSQFSPAQLTMASQVFADMSIQLIKDLKLSRENTELTLEKLREANLNSYRGQVLDTQVLLGNRRDRFDDESYLSMYHQRSQLLNAPYGFGMWIAAIVNQASVLDAEIFSKIGDNIGAGLQLINDLNGITADKTANKLTLPVWLQNKQGRELFERVLQQISPYKEKTGELIVRLSQGEGRNLLEQASYVLSSNKIFNTFV